MRLMRAFRNVEVLLEFKHPEKRLVGVMHSITFY